jgi:hypothetical protein
MTRPRLSLRGRNPGSIWFSIFFTFLQQPERRLCKVAGDCPHRCLVTVTAYYPFIQLGDVTLWTSMTIH